MRSMRFLVAAAAAALLTPALTETAFAQSAQDTARARAQKLEQQREAERKRALEKQFPVGASWVLTDIGGKRPPAGVEATLRIDATFRGTGLAGCNRFSAAMYPAREQTLVAGPPALTRLKCPAPVMAFERTYLQALYSRPKWDLFGDTLTLKTRFGVLRFRRTI